MEMLKIDKKYNGNVKNNLKCWKKTSGVVYICIMI